MQSNNEIEKPVNYNSVFNIVSTIFRKV